jgi:hypothetical protein
MKKILGYDGFNYENPIRQKEVYNAIKWNAQFFDKIFIFCKRPLDFDFYNQLQNEVIETKPTESPEDISMQDLFNLVNRFSSPDDIKIFTNLDTIFSPSWNDVDIADNVFMFFTNRTTEEQPYGNEGLDVFNEKAILDPTRFANYNDPNPPSTIRDRWLLAQCGWSWKTIKPILGEAFLGNRGAEHAFLRQVRNAGYTAKSGALKYPTYHNHNSNIRTDKQLTIVDSASGPGRLESSEVL